MVYIQFTAEMHSYIPLDGGIPLAPSGSYSSRHLVSSIRLLLPPPHLRGKPSLVDTKPGLEATALLSLLGLLSWRGCANNCFAWEGEREGVFVWEIAVVQLRDFVGKHGRRNPSSSMAA